MECTSVGEAVDFAFVSRRHNSLTARGCFVVFGSLAVLSIAIAAGFSVFGAWPIIPFAGLEIVVLALALRCIWRRAGDFERVTIEGDRLVLERCEESRLRRFEFNRCWARLVLQTAGGNTRVALRSHGREVEVGCYVGEDRRRALALALKQHLARY
jgi:uncharacterized membrane protein